MSMSTRKVAVLLGVLVVAGAVLGAARAQGLGQANDNSMAALTNEVRQLRLAVQDAGRSQTQMQALSISLTAQQSRLSQVSDRLDKTHAELAAVGVKAEGARRMIAEAQAEMGRATTVQERGHAGEMLELFKKQAQEFFDEENRLRAREAELTNQFRAEEQRWLELVARLEEIIKR